MQCTESLRMKRQFSLSQIFRYFWRKSERCCPTFNERVTSLTFWANGCIRHWKIWWGFMRFDLFWSHLKLDLFDLCHIDSCPRIWNTESELFSLRWYSCSAYSNPDPVVLSECFSAQWFKMNEIEENLNPKKWALGLRPNEPCATILTNLESERNSCARRSIDDSLEKMSRKKHNSISKFWLAIMIRICPTPKRNQSIMKKQRSGLCPTPSVRKIKHNLRWRKKRRKISVQSSLRSSLTWT